MVCPPPPPTHRRSQYAFFIKHFNLTADPAELPLTLLTCKQLLVTATGQIASDPAYADAVFAPDLVVQYASDNAALLAQQRAAGNEKSFLSTMPDMATARSGVVIAPTAGLQAQFFGSYFYASGNGSAAVNSGRGSSGKRQQRGGRVGAAGVVQPVVGDVEKWVVRGEYGCVSTVQVWGCVWLYVVVCGCMWLHVAVCGFMW